MFRRRHGVVAVLKIYAHCIDGQADAANQRITDALSTQDANWLLSRGHH